MKNRESDRREQKIFIANENELFRDANNILDCQLPRINEYEFKGLYQANEIKKDKECEPTKTAQEQKFVKTLALGAAACDWLGDEIAIISPAGHDAKALDIDLLAEIVRSPENQDEEPLVLALSVSVGNDLSELPQKIRKNAERLNNKNCRIKYFQSPIDAEQRALDSTIPVIITLDKKHAEELNRLAADILKLGTNIRDTGFNNKERTRQLNDNINKFKNHPAQLTFLKEIVGQIDFFADRLNKTTQNGTELLARLDAACGAMEKAIARKNIETDDSAALEIISSL